MIRTRSALFLLLKLCLFGFLATTSLYVHAEYYLVYSTPDYYDMCSNCLPQPQRKHHIHRKVTVKKTVVNHTTHRVHHRYSGGGSLSVYYPAVFACPCTDVFTLGFCHCCPHPNRVRTEAGDYVVFSSRPADRRHGISEEESSYNPDLSTSDDGRADLEVN